MIAGGCFELICARCELAYASVNPSLDEIEHPVCQSCLRKDEEKPVKEESRW